MNELSAMVDRYLQLMEEALINAIYQDRATDPWSQPCSTPASAIRGWTGRSRPSHDRPHAA